MFINLIIFSCIILLAGCSSIGIDKPVNITKEKAINLARDNVEKQEFYKHLPSKELELTHVKLIALTKKKTPYWQVQFSIEGLSGNINTLINPENGEIVSTGFTKPLKLENGVLKIRE